MVLVSLLQFMAYYLYLSSEFMFPTTTGELVVPRNLLIHYLTHLLLLLLLLLLHIKGMLFGMPDAFMRLKAKETLNITLPPQGEYAVGNIFFPPENPEALKDCKAILERLTKQRSGLEVLGWRKVPVDNSMLGQDPLDSEPDTEQVNTSFTFILFE
jgi:hypothetical protein